VSARPSTPCAAAASATGGRYDRWPPAEGACVVARKRVYMGTTGVVGSPAGNFRSRPATTKQGCSVSYEHAGPVGLVHRWSYVPTSAVPGRARLRLTPILQAWGLSAPELDDTLLVMNELVANAVDHARTPLVLLVSFTGAVVLIEVIDDSADEPRLQPFDLTASRGRGLQFVDSLAERWGWRAHSGGKAVWAEMPVAGSAEQRPPGLPRRGE
jgi:hypothetical protein